MVDLVSLKKRIEESLSKGNDKEALETWLEYRAIRGCEEGLPIEYRKSFLIGYLLSPAASFLESNGYRHAIIQEWDDYRQAVLQKNNTQ